MLNAVYCNPLIFFSLLWLTNLFLKRGFCKTEPILLSVYTSRAHECEQPFAFLATAEALVLFTANCFLASLIHIPPKSHCKMYFLSLPWHSACFLCPQGSTQVHTNSPFGPVSSTSYILFSLASSPRTQFFCTHSYNSSFLVLAFQTHSFYDNHKV